MYSRSLPLNLLLSLLVMLPKSILEGENVTEPGLR